MGQCFKCASALDAGEEGITDTPTFEALKGDMRSILDILKDTAKEIGDIIDLQETGVTMAMEDPLAALKQDKRNSSQQTILAASAA